MEYIAQFKMMDGRWQIVCELGTEATLKEMKNRARSWIMKTSYRSPWRAVKLRIIGFQIVGKPTILRVGPRD